jgi:hypothetical protein
MGGALLQIIWRSVSELLQTVKRSANRIGVRPEILISPRETLKSAFRV